MHAMKARGVIRLLGMLGACAALSAWGSGCGSGTAAAIDPVAQAAQDTTHVGGAHMSFSGSVQVGGLVSPITLTGSGYFNFARREGSFSFAMSGLPASAQGALGGGSLQIVELFKQGTLYMGSPLLAGVSGGRRWVSLDIARVGHAIGLDPTSLTSGGANPADYLRYLDAAGARTAAVGHGDVRGVPTTHYSGTLDLVRAADALPGSDRAQARAAIEQLVAQTGQRAMPIEVWVDAHRLVRRISLSLSFSNGGRQASTTIRADYYDFGPTPAVNAPPSSEVLDITGQALTHLPGAAG
jgi:hypothetical protein